MIRRARSGGARHGVARKGAQILLGALLVPLVVGFSPAPPARGDELSQARATQQALGGQIESQRKQVARLTALQASLKGDLANTRVALARVNADQAAIKRTIGGLAEEIAVIESDYRDLVATTASLDTQLVQVEREESAKAAALAERKSILADRLRAAYDAGRTSLLETLLSAGSFTDVVADIGYYLDFGEQDKALGEQIGQDQEALATLHRSVSQTRKATDELRTAAARQREQVAARITELRGAQDQLAKLEAETNRQLAKQRGAYAGLARNKKALADQIAREQKAQDELQRRIDALVRARAGRGNVPSVYNGSFVWPISGIVTQEFGCTGFPWEPPLGDCAHFHRGIDIANDMLTPIRAAGDGTVVFAGPNPFDPYPKAWIVIIAHSQNLLTWYAHVDDQTRPPVVQAGQVVRQGDVIAYEGRTGRVTGPHLDWRVELNGAFVNPRLFV